MIPNELSSRGINDAAGQTGKENIMNIETLTSFFMWCSVLNGGLLILWSLMFLAAPDLIYRMQSKWFSIPRATYNVLIYAFLGLFKIFVIIFNLVPYLALLILQ